MVVFDFIEDIKRCIRHNAPFKTVPRCTPEAFYPEHAKLRRAHPAAVSPNPIQPTPPADQQTTAVTVPLTTSAPSAPRPRGQDLGGRG